MAHQKSPADTWYSVNTDLELVTNHFTVARKSSVQENSSAQPRISGKNPLYRFKIKLAQTGTALASDITTKNDLATHVPTNTGAQSA